MQKKSGMSVGKVAAVTAGVTALAAAGYLLFGPNGKKNRNKMKGWMVKMKGEVIEKIEDLKEITKPIYDRIVDSVSAEYMKNKKNAPEDIARIARDLKRAWKNISTQATKKTGGAKKKKAQKKTKSK